jgi:hypothetical protein
VRERVSHHVQRRHAGANRRRRRVLHRTADGRLRVAPGQRPQRVAHLHRLRVRVALRFGKPVVKPSAQPHPKLSPTLLRGGTCAYAAGASCCMHASSSAVLSFHTPRRLASGSSSCRVSRTSASASPAATLRSAARRSASTTSTCVGGEEREVREVRRRAARGGECGVYERVAAGVPRLEGPHVGHPRGSLHARVQKRACAIPRARPSWPAAWCAGAPGPARPWSRRSRGTGR